MNAVFNVLNRGLGLTSIPSFFHSDISKFALPRKEELNFEDEGGESKMINDEEEEESEEEEDDDEEES